MVDMSAKYPPSVYWLIHSWQIGRQSVKCQLSVSGVSVGNRSSIGRYVGRYVCLLSVSGVMADISTETQSILGWHSTDTQPILNQHSTDYKPIYQLCIGRVLVDISVHRLTLPTVNMIHTLNTHLGHIVFIGSHVTQHSLIKTILKQTAVTLLKSRRSRDI